MDKTKIEWCDSIDSAMPNNGGTRCRFWCGHKNKRYMYDYCRTHKIKKMPGFVCFGGGLYGAEPTIKTSPAWCPLREVKKIKTRVIMDGKEDENA